MRVHRFSAWTLLALSSLATASAAESDSVTFTYDVHGRLTQVASTASGGSTTSYTYDAADNRSNVTVTTGGAPTPSFSVSNASVTEGGAAVFTVTKTGSTSSSFTVNYATADGTATSGSDYTATSGTLTFAATEASKTVSVMTIDDAIVESSETFVLNLSAASGGATITSGQGTATIADNDTVPPSFAIGNASVTEGGTLVLTVTKTGSTSNSFSVNYATANGTAAAGSDYTAASGTLTFAPANTSKTISISTIDDAIAESAETVLVNLSGPSGGATITDAQGVGTINDNDTPPGPSFSVNNSSADEGGVLIFTITKAGATSGTYSVNYATANGTAAAPADYVATSGTLTFTSTQTQKTVSVTINNDIRPESNETFYLNLSGATGGATISDAQGVGTIFDVADPCPLC